MLYRIRYDQVVSQESQGWRWVYYKAANGKVPVREFIRSQPLAVQEKIYRDLTILCDLGVLAREPLVKKLEGTELWELRSGFGGDIYRTLYVARTGRKFLLLSAFQKKSQKTPVREIRSAQARLADYERRLRDARERKSKGG